MCNDTIAYKLKDKYYCLDCEYSLDLIVAKEDLSSEYYGMQSLCFCNIQEYLNKRCAYCGYTEDGGLCNGTDEYCKEKYICGAHPCDNKKPYHCWYCIRYIEDQEAAASYQKRTRSHDTNVI